MKINPLPIKRGNPKILSLTFEKEGWAEADGGRGTKDQQVFPRRAMGLHVPLELWSPARFQIPALPLPLGRPCLLRASVSPFTRWVNHKPHSIE